MKFSTYTPAVRPNTINARVDTSVVKEAFGTGGKELGAWASAANQMVGVIQKRQDEDDAADIMAARNEISRKVNKSLYSENGIVTTGKGKNAQGMTDRIGQSVQDITQEVAENYNGRVRYQLMNKYLPQDMEQYSRVGMQTENRERESYQTETYKSRISELENAASIASRDLDTFYSTIREAEETIGSRGLQQGWDEATTLTQKKNFRTQAVGGAVTSYLSQGEFDEANALLGRERKNINQDEYTRLYDTVSKQKKIQDNANAARSIFDKCYNPETNEFDTTAAQKMAREACTVQGADMSAQVERGYQKWAEKQMPHGTEGCVEAAVRILGTDNNNPWIQSIQGETYVPSLVQLASGENGPGVVDYSADQVEPGDMIVYGDNDHVVVATGGTGYVGNSSSQVKVVRGGDYREMGGLVPSKIIKSSHLGGDVSTTFDADKYDRIMAEVMGHYNKNANIYNVGQKQKVQDLEAELAACDTFAEQQIAVENSGLDPKTKNQYMKRIQGAMKQAARSAGGGGGYSRAGSSNSKYDKERNNYIGSWTEEEDLNLIDEYNERMDDPDDTISAADQKKYNKATRRYNYYHQTGTADLANTDVLDLINEYKNQGYSYTQIWESLGDAMSDESKVYYLRAAFGG